MAYYKCGRQRINEIDALRGVAVLCMLTQHIFFWLSAHPTASIPMQIAGAAGGLAAPIFIILAGLGATLTVHGGKRTDFLLAGRGVVIMGFGYLLNLLAPHWFAPGSWYVLHMIGFGILSAPLLRRLSDHALVLLVITVIVATAFIQNALGTPLHLANCRMACANLPGGYVRSALAEGFFPIFPWIAFFIVGVLSGRRVIDGSHGFILGAGIVFLGISIVLSGIYFAAPSLAGSGLAVRFFKPVSNFYPALTPVTLFLVSVVLILISAFLALNRFIPIKPTNPLVCMGRSSLTILIVHIVVIRESAVRFNFWRSFTIAETAVFTTLAILLIAGAVRFWRKVDYRFGAEWVLRVIGGKTVKK